MAAIIEQDADADRAFGGNWVWALASGLVTVILAVIAFLLPVMEWVPRGGLVGWLLFLAGTLEFALGWRRGADPARRAATGSGLLTLLAGLLFMANPLAGYFPVANIVTVWLLLRGAWVLLAALRVRDHGLRPWLAVSGAADMLLAFVLMAGFPVAAAVVAVFGPTREIIARFALILAASFLVTGFSQIAIALVQRGRSGTGS